MAGLAIVILNWNGISFLESFFPILVEKTKLPGVEIIVADNNSSDNSVEFLRKNYSGIRIIELEENYGFAGGYNKALEQVTSEYYLLLNSDIEVTDKWLEPLVTFMEGNREIAACSPMILDQLNKTKYEYAGAAGGYIDKFGYTFCRGRIFNRVEAPDPGLKEPLEVFWTTGACMLIRSDIFRSAGGFDSRFFAHMEEVDLCWRLKNSGHRVAMVPGSKIFHVGGGTLHKSNPFKTYLNFRNNLLMLYKNLPEERLKKILFTRMMMDGLSAGMFLLSFKFRDIGAIYRAHSHFRRDKKKYTGFRKEQQSSHGYPGLSEIYQKSVVADYFLAGRKTFGKLRDSFAEKMDKKTIIQE